MAKISLLTLLFLKLNSIFTFWNNDKMLFAVDFIHSLC